MAAATFGNNGRRSASCLPVRASEPYDVRLDSPRPVAGDAPEFRSLHASVGSPFLKFMP